MVTSMCTWVHVVGDLSHDWPLGAFFCKFNSFAQGSTPTPLSVGKPSNATSLYVCLSASISPIKTTRPKFAEFPVHVTRCREWNRSSWRLCDRYRPALPFLSSSGNGADSISTNGAPFVHDVMFASNG